MREYTRPGFPWRYIELQRLGGIFSEQEGLISKVSDFETDGDIPTCETAGNFAELVGDDLRISAYRIRPIARSRRRSPTKTRGGGATKTIGALPRPHGSAASGVDQDLSVRQEISGVRKTPHANIFVDCGIRVVLQRDHPGRHGVRVRLRLTLDVFLL